MSRDDLHLLTAFALGELQGAEKTRIENMIRNDPALQKAVKEIQQTAGILAKDLRSSDSVGLSPFEKSKLERGWQDLAQNESKPSFFRNLFGPLPALAAATAAFVIVLFVSRPTIVEEFQRKPPQDAAVESGLAPPMMEAKESAKLAPPADEVEPSEDRKALFVKIEKKEVNPEVGSQDLAKDVRTKGDTERTRATTPSSAFGVSKGQSSDGPYEIAGVAKAKKMAQNMAPQKSIGAGSVAPSMSKSAHQVPLSVLFGGDGEQVTGAPDGRGVKEVLRGMTPQFLTCYSTALENQQGTKGKLILRWKIKRGRATGVANASSTLGNATLEACVIGNVKKAHFGPESNGANVVMPFQFMSTN